MEANIWTTLFSGAIGAIIGTYGGSFILAKRQENKIVKVRNIAIKGLKNYQTVC